jgi:membrane-associated phospholipid phosphatase
MLTWFKRDWFSGTFKQRLPLVLALLTYQTLYFPINRYLADKGGWVADIEIIDGNMPLIPIFVIPYVLGFILMPLFPLIAAWKFPRPLFQEYMVAFFLAMTLGFTIWLLLPAYVVKQPIEGSGFFLGLVKRLHGGDDTYGTHNAIPSSHVYYISLAMIYYIRYNPRLFWPMTTFAILNALSTMFTHQHYLLDVLAGFGMTWAVWRVAHDIATPKVQAFEVKHGLVKPSGDQSAATS